MANHLVLLLGLRCPRRGFDAVLRGRPGHAAPGHQHHDVPDVGDVGYGAQRVVHHGLLKGEGVRLTRDYARNGAARAAAPAKDGHF